MLTCRYFFKDKDHFGIHTQALKSGANLQDHDATFNFYYIFDNPIPSWMCATVISKWFVFFVQSQLWKSVMDVYVMLLYNCNNTSFSAFLHFIN